MAVETIHPEDTDSPDHEWWTCPSCRDAKTFITKRGGEPTTRECRACDWLYEFPSEWWE